jgi:hypothetical protein
VVVVTVTVCVGGVFVEVTVWFEVTVVVLAGRLVVEVTVCVDVIVDGAWLVVVVTV